LTEVENQTTRRTSESLTSLTILKSFPSSMKLETHRTRANRAANSGHPE
jgi:hypothetical protein